MIGLINEALQIDENDEKSSTPEKRNDRLSFVISTCERVVKLFASHVLISTSSSKNASIDLSLETRLGDTEHAQFRIDCKKEK